MIHAELFCPVTKQPLHKINNTLVSEDGRHHYPLEQDIAIFSEISKLDDYWQSDNPNQMAVETRLLEFLKPHYVRTLDVGCGNGRCLQPLSTISDIIYGIDNSYQGLLGAQQRNIDNATLLAGDISTLPFPDDYFDLVANITVIEHLPDPMPMLHEVVRVLKPAGDFIIRNDAWFYRILERLHIIKFKTGPDPTHVTMLTPQKLQTLLESCGFSIHSAAYFPFYRWLPKWSTKGFKSFSTKANFVCRLMPSQ